MHLRFHKGYWSPLDNFVEMHDADKFEEAALAENLDMSVSFDERAIDAVIVQALETGQMVGSLAKALGKKLEYGLNLVRDRSGIENVTITDEAVTDMEGFIDNLIKKLPHQESLPKFSDRPAEE